MTLSEIKTYCNINFPNAKCSVTPNGVNVIGDIMLYNKNLEKLPFRFNNIDGNFYCHRNQLTSLYGAPKMVTGDFFCNDNRLTSLEYCPIEVGGDFYCYGNIINTLFFSPIKVGGDFNFNDTLLTSLYSRYDIIVNGWVVVPWLYLPKQFMEINDEEFNIILKYQRLYEIWDEDYDTHDLIVDNFNILIEEIRDGLE